MADANAESNSANETNVVGGIKTKTAATEEAESTSTIELRQHDIHDIRKLSEAMVSTPLVSIEKLQRPHSFSCDIKVKCEFRHPSGSMWDRYVVHKIMEAKKNGVLTRETQLVTGGRFDICKSLAWAGATGNIPVSVVPMDLMNEAQSLILKSFGANVILSFSQDPLREKTIGCLTNHIKQLQDTSGIHHFPILPSSENSGKDGSFFDDLVNELVSQGQKTGTKGVDTDLLDYDLFVFPGGNDCLTAGICKAIAKKSSKVMKIIIAKSSLPDIFDDVGEVRFNDSDIGHIDSRVITIPEAEAYDMTRRLIREEGLLAGPTSGATMCAAMKAINEFGLGDGKNMKVLVVLPDSLSSSTHDFLSTEWMILKGYYNPAQLESLYWWYEMAIENLSPPTTLIVSSGTTVREAWKAMRDEPKTERAVVVSKEDRNVIGVLSFESLVSLMNTAHEEVSVEDICCRMFGVIDSKATFPELETVLRKYNWVVNVHRLNYYCDNKKPETPQRLEEIIGAINLADFMKYKKKVEAHHLTEYGISMSDGIPSDIWIEKFNGQLRKVDETSNNNGKAEAKNN